MSIFDVTIDPEWKKVDPDYETAVIPLLDAIDSYKATNWGFLKNYFVDMFTLVSLDNNANRIPDAMQFLTIQSLNFNDLTPGTTTYDSETHAVISSTDGTTNATGTNTDTQPTIYLSATLTGNGALPGTANLSVTGDVPDGTEIRCTVSLIFRDSYLDSETVDYDNVARGNLIMNGGIATATVTYGAQDPKGKVQGNVIVFIKGVKNSKITGKAGLMLDMTKFYADGGYTPPTSGDTSTPSNPSTPSTPTTPTTYTVKTYGRRDRVIKALKEKALELQWVAKLEQLNMEATENSVFIGIYGNPYTEDIEEINIYKEILISKKYLEMLTWLNSPLLSLIVYPRPEYILDVKEDDM
jgi:hypothetical protein